MRHPFFAVPVFLGLLAVACGGATTGGNASPLTGPTPVVRSPQCPATVPVTGTSCPSSQNVECEYGTDIHCTQIAICAESVGTGLVVQNSPTQPTGYTWFVESSDPSCNGNSPSCGSSFAKMVNGTACSPNDSCTFPEGRCTCGSCVENGDSNDGQWSCEAWETPQGCPAERPLLGTACSTEGEECDYGQSCCDPTNVGPAMTCVGGFWANGEQSCECGVALCGAP